MRILFILALLSLSFTLHDFHVTHTTLHYNSEKASIEITIKVAVDDLERALEDQGARDLRIGAENENEKADQWIRDYFKKHLKISPNNQVRDFSWVGKEVSKDLHDLYVYAELGDCNKNGLVESLVVENTIFTEILHDQSNIVLVEFGERKQNLTFTRAKSRQTVKIKTD